MKEWIINLAFTVIILTLISMILPDGKIGKYVSSIFPLIILLVVIKPIVNFDPTNVKNPFNYVENSLEIQTDFIESIVTEKKENCQKKCMDILEKNGIKDAVITIKYIDSDIACTVKNVTVDLRNSFTYKACKDQIDIDKIKETISQQMFITYKAVNVYE